MKYSSKKKQLCFPSDFLIGSATSAHQIEGHIGEESRDALQWSIWDFFCRGARPSYHHHHASSIQQQEQQQQQQQQMQQIQMQMEHWNTKLRHQAENPSSPVPLSITSDSSTTSPTGNHLECADVADDELHRLREDIELMAKMGYNTYRFSVAWNRVVHFQYIDIQPTRSTRTRTTSTNSNPSNTRSNATSTSKSTNPIYQMYKMSPNYIGLEYYHTLIQTCLQFNITPILTMYHFDLPAVLSEHPPEHPPIPSIKTAIHRNNIIYDATVHHYNQHDSTSLSCIVQSGGWLAPNIIQAFTCYGRILFHEFGKHVEYWSTFNEPWSFTKDGYGTGVHAPGMTNSTSNTYIAAHNVLLAHAKVVQLFRKLKTSNQIQSNAKIGLILNADYSYPLDPTNANDVLAAERRMFFQLGWFLYPLTKGDYPPIMKEYAREHLPTFTPSQSYLVQNSYDILYLNHYSSIVVTDCNSSTSLISCDQALSLGWERDLGIDGTRFPNGARVANTNSMGQPNCIWFSGYAQGYIDTIRWMHRMDPNTNILLTENGWCGNDTIDNEDQLWYHRSYLHQVYLAVVEEQIPIVGYTAWSFMDNYEWGSYEPRFGLFHVDRETLVRRPRPAALFLGGVARTKCFIWEDNDDRIGVGGEKRDTEHLELWLGIFIFLIFLMIKL